MKKLTNTVTQDGLPVRGTDFKPYEEISTYTELRQQIHDDLRIQHPEWVHPNGESPMCDFYEARLMEQLPVDAKGLN
jgi:hypothetical protein